MSMDLINSNDQKIKSFWDRKEGTWGMGTLAILGVLGIGGLKVFGPTILAALAIGTAIMGQAIMLTILGAVLAFIIWVLFFTKFPALVSFWFKAAVRRMASTFVAIYPIEIIEMYVQKMREKALEFAKGKQKIKEQERIVRSAKKQAEDEKKEALLIMQAAQKKGDAMEATLQAQIAGQHDETITKFLDPSIAQMSMLYERLSRVEKVIDFKIRGMESQAKNLKRQHAISKATKSALSAGWAILRGADPDKEMYDMAVDYVIEDYDATMGMVDDFMASTESILNGVDLKNGMWEEKALEMLAQLDQKEQLLISKTPEANVIIPTIRSAEAQAANLPSSNLGSKYFS